MTTKKILQICRDRGLRLDTFFWARVVGTYSCEETGKHLDDLSRSGVQCVGTKIDSYNSDTRYYIEVGIPIKW
jgi:hypothetical protein